MPQKQHSAVKLVAELKEKLNADKLARTVKMESKQNISKKPHVRPFQGKLANQTTAAEDKPPRAKVKMEQAVKSKLALKSEQAVKPEPAVKKGQEVKKELLDTVLQEIKELLKTVWSKELQETLMHEYDVIKKELQECKVRKQEVQECDDSAIFQAKS